MNTLLLLSKKPLPPPFFMGTALLMATFLLSVPPVMAQEPNWQESYQFEAKGQYNKAIDAIESVPINGADAELKTLRNGWLYYLLGRYDESIREYRLAIERNGQSMDARLGVILPLLVQKRWREAEQSAQAALDLSPNNYYALLRLAMAREGQQDWVAMAETAEQLVTCYPSDMSAHLYLARAYARLQRRKEAFAAYQAVLVRAPGHLEAKAYLNKP